MRKSAVPGANKHVIRRGGTKKPSERQRFIDKREDRRNLQDRLRIPDESEQLSLVLLDDLPPVPRAPSGRLANV